MCNSNKKITPNTGMALLTTANPNLNGTGSIVDIITGANDGTMIDSLTIKSLVSNNQGMIRLFIKDLSSVYYLFQEIMIPTTVPTSVVQSYAATVELGINLKAGYSLAASTQLSENFSLIAYGTNYEMCDCNVK
ncbi:MAG: hypothetical protein JST70_11935 [Bacteroidetes bacterium]|nr:hypothetical protein [Bacteroidota bacterium]